MSFSLFSFQTEHLPLQTQFKEREAGSLQHSVSNTVLWWDQPRWSRWPPCLLKYHCSYLRFHFIHLSSEHL